MTEEKGPGGQGWLWAPVALSFLGIFVSGYLSVKRLTGGSLACSRWAQCDTVNNSVYAKISGIPVAFIGLAGYLLLLGLAVAALHTWGPAHRRLLAISFVLALGGVGFSAYLSYIELFVIHAICNWCVASAVVITLLAIVDGINLWRATPPQLDTSLSPSSTRS
ncbi:MAG TPA: vitamin K epoxide reductase family protein [Candidatus Acidoferrum sp.]|nr:vitamin K epoxide reductase family protein [Candidatus Acidoferrum sp.]